MSVHKFILKYYKWPALVFLLLFFIILFKPYIGAMKYYSNLLLLILVFAFTFLLLFYKNYKEKRDLFMAIFAVVITVLFFILQNFQVVSDNENSIIAANRINYCKTEKFIKEIDDDQQKNHITIYTDRYLTDTYKNNLSFLFKKLGGENFINLTTAITNLDDSNRLLDNIQSTSEDSINSFNNYNDKTGGNILQTLNNYDGFIKYEANQVMVLASSTTSKLITINQIVTGNKFISCPIN